MSEDFSLDEMISNLYVPRRSKPRVSNMNTVKVYRIEHDDGRGMYKFIYPNGRQGRNHDYCNPKHPSQNCPSPTSDDILCGNMRNIINEYYNFPFDKWEENGYNLIGQGPKDCPWNRKTQNRYMKPPLSPWYFGFSFIHQFRAWMNNDDIRDAIYNDLHMSVYEIHKTAVCYGESQCIFFMPCARRIERRSLKKYLK